MTLPFLARRVTSAAPKPRPQLVAWTAHFRVAEGRVYARDAWVLFPGDVQPRLVPVDVAA